MIRAIPRNQKIHTEMFREDSSRKQAVKSDSWKGQ